MPRFRRSSSSSLPLHVATCPGWLALLKKADERTLTSMEVKRIIGLSYRQLTDWESRGMLKPIFARPFRVKTEGWRKFSVVDLLCLSFLKEARSQGISITRLQGLMGKLFSLTGFFYDTISHVVYGLDVFVCSNLKDLIYVASPTGEDQWSRIIKDLKKSDLMVILPLNRIVDDLFQKLKMPDFQAIKKREGGYSFIINGVPLALEPLPGQANSKEPK